VFGWQWGGSDEYAEVQVAGRTVGGVMPRRPELPTNVPDHWLVYFSASDVDADTTRAADLGATVIVEPSEVPGIGRFSVLLYPQGEAFALHKG